MNNCVGSHSGHLVTRGEGLRLLANSVHEMKFCRTSDEALYCFRIACKYKSLTSPHYCGSRPCERCYVQQLYNEQLRVIAFADEILKSGDLQSTYPS